MCMCVCREGACTCVYVCVCVGKGVCTYVSVCGRERAFLLVYVFARVHVRVLVWGEGAFLCVYVFARVHACVYAYEHACVRGGFVCVHACTRVSMGEEGAGERAFESVFVRA